MMTLFLTDERMDEKKLRGFKLTERTQKQLAAIKERVGLKSLTAAIEWLAGTLSPLAFSVLDEAAEANEMRFGKDGLKAIALATADLTLDPRIREPGAAIADSLEGSLATRVRALDYVHAWALYLGTRDTK